MSADHIPDTSGRREHHMEDEIRELVQGSHVDPGPAGFVIPTVEADPVVVKTSEFCQKMKDQIDLVARQMDNRAYVLEKKAEELRTRASKLKHYGTSLTADMNSFAEMLVDYNNDVQSLALVAPKDTLPKGER